MQFLAQVYDFKQTKTYNSFMNIAVDILQSKESNVNALLKLLKNQSIIQVQGNDNFDLLLMGKICHALKDQVNIMGSQIRIMLS